jgi:uncharacterized protein YecT (DUF1311 family)
MLLRMKRAFFLTLLLLGSTIHLQAQLADASAATQAKCAQYLQTPLPPEATNVAPPKTWLDCNSYKLYSGIGTKIDYTAARECAWSERLATLNGFEPRYENASVFGGSAMLTVLYANGEGVEKNLPLALRFACEADGAPAEISYRLEHIESLNTKAPAAGIKFDFCADITSGFMEGFCAAYNSELVDQKRSETLNAISARMTPIQKEAFVQLLKEEEAYARAHANGEIDLSGTGRAMFQIDAEQTLRADFLAALQLFETGKYPRVSTQTYSGADARLNSAYRKAMGHAEKNMKDYGSVQPSGIRGAERAWLKYRDAWVAFAKLHYPSVPPEAWLILLTNDRTSILDDSFCDMDVEKAPCVQEGDTWKPSPLP